VGEPGEIELLAGEEALRPGQCARVGELEPDPGRLGYLVHQRLDVSGSFGVKNAEAVRGLLEDSKKVLAVFQGHHHTNDYSLIGNIHYCTLRSVVDGPFPDENGYAIVDLFKDGSIRIDGFRKQTDYHWSVS